MKRKHLVIDVPVAKGSERNAIENGKRCLIDCREEPHTEIETLRIERDILRGGDREPLEIQRVGVDSH